jgi:hypothetical protein
VAVSCPRSVYWCLTEFKYNLSCGQLCFFGLRRPAPFSHVHPREQGDRKLTVTSEVTVNLRRCFYKNRPLRKNLRCVSMKTDYFEQNSVVFLWKQTILKKISVVFLEKQAALKKFSLYFYGNKLFWKYFRCVFMELDCFGDNLAVFL